MIAKVITTTKGVKEGTYVNVQTVNGTVATTSTGIKLPVNKIVIL